MTLLQALGWVVALAVDVALVRFSWTHIVAPAIDKRAREAAQRELNIDRRLRQQTVPQRRRVFA